jgi:hypothetical protein
MNLSNQELNFELRGLISKLKNEILNWEQKYKHWTIK